MKDVTETVLNIIECLGYKNVITSDRLDDLGIDSLEIAGIMGACEYELNIDIPQYNGLTYVGDIVSLVKRNARE